MSTPVIVNAAETAYRIAPAKFYEGDGVLKNNKELLKNFDGRFSLLTEKKLLRKFSSHLSHISSRSEKTVFFKGECCLEEIERITAAIGHDCKMLVAFGGGKLLDTSKLVAQNLDARLFTIPSSAATCAAFTSIAPVYYESGLKRKTYELENCPDVCVLDYSLLLRQPSRLLASGIADALAKYYETRALLEWCGSYSNIPSVHAAFALSEIIYKKIFKLHKEAFNALSKKRQNSAFREIIYCCIVLPGIISGMGGKNCRSLGAHSLANALTLLDEVRPALHGERVGWGIIVQLLLEGKTEEALKLAEFFKQLGLPVSLKQLGVRKFEINYLKKVVQSALSPSENLRLMGSVASFDNLWDAIKRAENLAVTELS